MAVYTNFRQGLLGGKSLNRFSSFVTSGAEDYVLNGASASKLDVPPPSIKHVFEASDDEDEATNRTNARVTDVTHPSESDQHFVDAGPSWRHKVPPFQILVHSPSKRTSTLSGAYTLYTVSSLFHPPTSDTTSADSINSSPNTSRITVHRRFSHFVALHTALTRRLPGIALPPLPEKQYAGRFNDDFVEARRGDLERYLARIVRHPVARYAEVVTFFLSCENEQVRVRSHPVCLGRLTAPSNQRNGNASFLTTWALHPLGLCFMLMCSTPTSTSMPRRPPKLFIDSMFTQRPSMLGYRVCVTFLRRSDRPG